MTPTYRRILWGALIAILCACTLETPSNDGSIISGGESAVVTEIIDGDTIDVEINGVGYRVRYIGINTPERDEPCYSEATAANARLVAGNRVTLVRDESNTDPYGRLLRYVYVGSQMVNALLAQDGWAENAEYPPDTAHAATFRQLEAEAARRNLGCHPTGIFDDGNASR